MNKTREDITNYALALNLTGIRLLQLFSALLDSPKTFDEINQYFLENKYLKTKFSNDTFRNDLNALRVAGCQISRATKSNNYRYTLIKHPFNLRIDEKTVQALKKLYNSYLHFFKVEELIEIDTLLKTLSKYSFYENIKEYLLGISILKSCNIDLLKELMLNVQKNNNIRLLYLSKNRGEINIDILCEKLSVKNKKLYLTGYDFLHETVSSFPVKNIKAILTTNLKKTKNISKPIKVIYALYDFSKEDLILSFGDKILSVQEDKITMEMEKHNEFFVVQRLLSYGLNCKVIEPLNIKQKVLNELKEIRKIYDEG